MPAIKITNVSVYLALAVLFALSSAAAPDQPAGAKEYACRQLAQSPVLDGEVVADPAWQDVPVAKDFRNLRTGLPPLKQTDFRIGYTADGLFVGIVCEEPNRDAIRADKADGERFWDEDSLAVLLAVGEEFLLKHNVPRFLFAVNAIGSRNSPLTLRQWQAAAYIGDKAWSAEIMLPWEVMGRFPGEGETWKFNVCRSFPASGDPEISTWANLEYRLFEEKNLGVLRFEAIPPEVRQAVETRVRDRAIEPELLVYSRPQVGVFVQSEFSKDRVVYNQGPHVAPQFSPDKTQVLFNSVEGGEMGIWIADRSDHQKKRIAGGCQATWSPGGEKIVFQRGGQIIERVLDSGAENAVSPEGAPRLAFPSYMPTPGAPDANSASRFLCTDESGRRIYLLSPGAEKPLDMVVEGEIGSAPRCSPDGKTVAYQDGAHIYLLDLQTRDSRLLTTEPGVQAWPVWLANGQGLCYVRAPSPAANMWDLCHVDAANPQVVNLIEPRIHPGFDLGGGTPESVRTTKALGARLALYRGKGSIDLARGPEGQAAWELIPERADAGALDGDVVVENDWLLLHVSGEGMRLVLKREGKAAPPMTLSVLDEARHPAGKASDIRLVRNFGDFFEVGVSFVTAENRTVKAVIRMPRARPLIEVRLDNAAGYVNLQADMALAVVPDRFSNDLLLVPAQLAPDAMVSLPQTPFVLGCLTDPTALLLMAALSDGSSFAVGNREDRGRLTAVSATSGDSGVAIAVLAGDRIWDSPELVRDTDKGAWSAQWDKPFLAEWRLAVSSRDEAYARMWTAADLSALGGTALPIEPAFANPPDNAVAYAWARDTVSPPDALTPSDILLDVLGVQGYMTALDIDGIRGYRSGNGTTPFRELIVHPTSWHPALAVDDESECGILETMGSIFAVGTSGVRSFITHLGGDAVEVLEGLDARIGEYDAFLADIAAFCEANQTDERQGFLTSVREQTAKVLEAGRAMPKTDIAKVKESLDKVLGIVGTRDSVTLPMFQAFCQLPGQEEWAAIYEEMWNYLAAKEGRLWHDEQVRYELWYEDDFKEFAQRCLKILAERQDVLTQYRTWAKQVRDGAARVVIAEGAFKPVGDELRDKTWTILRNRYYLERDWRGETPAPSGVPR
ncbi:MAG TPA: hypothetical protein VMZ06_16065 [Candidatus Bathyarchaeia archaeon]|nr:hypothetical protein [Candidatus Bathyarchaeia archaeon]